MEKQAYKTVKVGHTMTGSNRAGRVLLKSFLFQKRKAFYNRNGEVSGEVPYDEVVYLLTVGDKSLWLRPYDIAYLKDLLSEADDLVGAPARLGLDLSAAPAAPSTLSHKGERAFGGATHETE